MGLLNPISAAVKLVDTVEDLGKALVSTTLDVAELAADVTEKCRSGRLVLKPL